MTLLPLSWHWWAATVSAACVARLRTVADWWRSWPTANRLACLCSCQWWTFWTYLVNVSLMNFMFHTTLDAVGNILRVRYKSMKCDVSFSQGRVSTLFRWREHVFHVCVKCSFRLQQCKNYKNQTSFSRVMITNVLPRLYESQCICPTTHRMHSVGNAMHRVKWRNNNLWSQYDLYVVGQHGVLCEVKWWRFVALFE